ncbi:hypothetical protein KY289_037490 [Solanum tuberosum]|nr:hypothetical protein KY289_037490 [Solanum tuberosum]
MDEKIWFHHTQSSSFTSYPISSLMLPVGEGIARKGRALAKVIPNFSSMSNSFDVLVPSSSFQLKEFKSEPNITGTILNVASGNSGHIL